MMPADIPLPMFLNVTHFMTSKFKLCVPSDWIGFGIEKRINVQLFVIEGCSMELSVSSKAYYEVGIAEFQIRVCFSDTITETFFTRESALKIAAHHLLAIMSGKF